MIVSGYVCTHIMYKLKKYTSKYMHVILHQ